MWRKSSIAAWLIRIQLCLTLVLPGGAPFSIVQAQQPPAESGAFSLAYVPRDAVLVVAARPSVLLQREVFAPLREAVEEFTASAADSTIDLSQIDELTLIAVAGGPGISNAFILRMESPQAVAGVLATFGRMEQQAEFAGQSYTA